MSTLPLLQIRLDVWLDVTCLFRTRGAAQKACRGGKINVNGQRAKPHRKVYRGDQITITRPTGLKQRIAVRELTDRSVPKAIARTLYEDHTPALSPDEVEFRHFLRRVAPSASPGKHERRRRRQSKERG